MTTEEMKIAAFKAWARRYSTDQRARLEDAMQEPVRVDLIAECSIAKEGIDRALDNYLMDGVYVFKTFDQVKNRLYLDIAAQTQNLMQRTNSALRLAQELRRLETLGYAMHTAIGIEAGFPQPKD